MSRLFIAVIFVATIFTEPPRRSNGRRSRRYAVNVNEIELRPRRDPLNAAVNVTQPLDNESR